MERWQDAVDRGWRVLATALVFLMQAGFMLLRVGSAHEKNTNVAIVTTVMDVGICAAVWLFLGYPAASALWPHWDYLASQDAIDWCDFAFSLALCMTCTTIVSGSVLERVHLNAYFLFATLVAGLIHPMAVRWAWSSHGWLNAPEKWADKDWPQFYDAGGGTVVHMVGGIAGLVFAVYIGPRIGRFKDKEGKAVNLCRSAPRNVYLAGTGIMIVWFGWTGFTGGSARTLSGGGAVVVSRILALTLLSPAAGLLTAACVVRLRRRRQAEPWKLLHGALAGLVAISAPCAVLDVWAAVVVSCIGVLISESVQALLARLKVDDPLCALAVHAGCGAWGTLAVGIFGASWSAHPASYKQFASQLFGVVVLAAWAVVVSAVSLFLLGRVMSLRATLELELRGLDHELFVGKGTSDTAENTAAPEGVVVIVITDVQGSTRLWVDDASSMAGATVVHDHVMRSEIAAHNGYEITTEGDAFQVAFSSIADALGFCLSAQRALLQADWKPDILRHPDAAPLELGGNMLHRGLRIRMGVDVGWCQRSLHETSRTFRYEGAAFDTAQRIVDCQTSGGIIVCSNTIQEEIAPRISRLGNLITFCDLGTYKLSPKDTEPIGLFAVMHPDMSLRVPLMGDLEVHELVSNGYMQAPGIRSMHFAVLKSVSYSSRTASFCYDMEPRTQKRWWASRLLGRTTITQIPKSSKSNPKMQLEPREAIVICFATVLRPWGSQDMTQKSLGGRSESDWQDSEDDAHSACFLGEPNGQEDAPMIEARAAIRATLEPCGGYECQEDKGVFMLAFEDCHKACRWGAEMGELIVDKFSKHFRFAMGVHVGVPTEVRPHGTTGRADYFGTVVNAAARVHSLSRKDAAGRGACIYVTPEVHEKAVESPGDPEDGRAPLQFTHAGKFPLKGFKEKIDIFRVDVPSVSQPTIVAACSTSLRTPVRTSSRKYTGSSRRGQDDSEADLSRLVQSLHA